MKPKRLKLLIAILITIGCVIGVYGFLSDELTGLWPAAVLTCVFTSHLLNIPHNSGRYWSCIIAIGLFTYAIYKLSAHLGWFGIQAPEALSLAVGLGIPIFTFLSGFLVVKLTFDATVCKFFDQSETD